MLKKFINNTAGNFSMMMAGTALTLIGGIGLSVDYMGMTDSAASLQSAVDGAALAAALKSDSTQEEIKAAADELFKTLRAQGFNVQSDYVFTEGSIIVKAQTQYTPRIMGALGFGTRTISATAEVPLGTGSGLDLVLVLDVTNSMNENEKLERMQDAVNGFLNNFQADDSNVRVSIVPFSQYVNVGTHNAGQIWLDNSQDGSTFPPSIHTITESTCPTSQVEQICTNTNDGVKREFICTRCDGGTVRTEVGTEIIEPLKTWDGCVGSRQGTRAVQAGYDGTAFPAVYDDGRVGADYWRTDYNCPSDAVLPLTDNISTVQTLVSGLRAGGTTYMPSGLAWGWRVLDDDLPLGVPIADGDNRKKVLILMTDGFNTVARRDANLAIDNDGRYHHGEFGGNDDVNAEITAEANAVTATLCTNIANDDIQTFTIAYDFPNTGNADIGRALLRNCAAEDGFFDASDSNQLNAAFDSIAGSLSDIRLIN